MKQSTLIGFGGGAVLITSTLLPFVNYYGVNYNLWNYPVPQTTSALLFVLLAAIGSFAVYRGGKLFGMLAIGCGVCAIAITVLKTGGAFALFGIGAWFMPLGGGLLILGAAGNIFLRNNPQQ
ncbi:MAG TPA: hypothetical protein VK177_03570 [Flavobacteriales bacterium]|nr:hypothetical protein [Flavobacteriales bacterium]